MNIEKFKKLGFKKCDSHTYIKALSRDWYISVDFWHNNDRKLVFSAILYIDGDTFTEIDSDDDIIRLASGMIDPQEYYDSI